MSRSLERWPDLGCNSRDVSPGLPRERRRIVSQGLLVLVRLAPVPRRADCLVENSWPAPDRHDALQKPAPPSRLAGLDKLSQQNRREHLAPVGRVSFVPATAEHALAFAAIACLAAADCFAAPLIAHVGPGWAERTKQAGRNVESE